MLTAEDGIKAAAILMQPGVYEGCQGVSKGLSLREVADQCLTNRKNIDKFFRWSATAETLTKAGVKITDPQIGNYYHYGDKHAFFEAMFMRLAYPEVKPLKEWM